MTIVVLRHLPDELVNRDPATCPATACPRERCPLSGCTCPPCRCPACLTRIARLRRRHDDNDVGPAAPTLFPLSELKGPQAA